MKRRDFIKSSLLVASGAILCSGCDLLNSSGIDTAKSLITTRKFKGEDISLLGYGCMRLPLTKSGGIDEKTNQEMVDRALNVGINYFDTAHMYMGGKSQEIMGRALKKHDRKSFKFVTKMPIMMLEKEADVERIFNEQLEKMQTKYFDFYLVHCITKQTWKTTKDYHVIEFLEKKKKEGIIKHLGFSFHDTPDLLKEVISSYDKWEFVQLQINKIDWNTCRADELYDIADKAKLPIIVMEPLRGGALANLNEAATKILRDYNPNASSASWAFRWLAGYPRIFTILSGMEKPEHLEDNIKTFTKIKPLSEEEQKVYDEAIKAHLQTAVIPCTGCRYCECPVGVNIAGIFSIYNQYKNNPKYKWSMVAYYEALRESERADKCINCRLCKSKCPQHLDIPTLLKQVDVEYKKVKAEMS